MSWVNEQTTSYTLQPNDNNKLVVINSSSAVTVTLPQPGVTEWVTGEYELSIANIGVGSVTLSPVSSTIDGLSSLTLNQFDGIKLQSDGTNWFTVRGVVNSNVSPAALFGSGSPNTTETPAIVQTISIAASSTGSVSGAFDSSVTSGNVLIVMYADFGSTSAPSISDTLGTSFTSYSVANGVFVYVGKATSSGTDTISLTGTGEYGVFVAYEASSVSTAVDNSLQEGSESTSPSLSQTTNYTDDLQFSFVVSGQCTALSETTVTSGWTLSDLADHLGEYCMQIQAAYNVAASPGANTVAWEVSQSSYPYIFSLQAVDNVSGVEGQSYFDTSSSTYVEWIYHSGNWHQVA